jgi:hypothetical protein
MSNDPLSFFRGLFHALWITLALILFGCVLAKSVWPDDINPRKEYRMQLIQNSMRAHGMEVPR